MSFDSQVHGFLEKLGAVKRNQPLEPLPMQPHQTRLIKKLQESPGGVVAYHSPGSGKTLSSIGAAEALGLPTHVAVPAALQANYHKELEKWQGHKRIPSVKVHSQQGIARKGLSLPQDSFLVVDESHKARDPDSNLNEVLSDVGAKKKLLMTGSGTYNHPADLAAMVNLVANKRVLPDNRADFERKFIKWDQVRPGIFDRMRGVKSGLKPTLNVTPELDKALRKYVDYYEIDQNNENFPDLKEETKYVPMSAKQTELYKTIMGKVPAWVRMKVRAGLPPNKKELSQLRAFMTGPRQVSNSTSAFYPNSPGESAKTDAAFKYLHEQVSKDPNYKAVVYSNFLDSGLKDYKAKLDSAGVPYGEFSGEIPDRVRQKLVKDYNANKLKALLISSAGAEGLDLKGTKLVQLLEPHFNEEKERQIIGRAKRYLSHAHLPEEERNVLVQRYLARPQGSMLSRLIGDGTEKGVDEYIRNLATQKSQMNDALINHLRKQNNSGMFSSLFNG